jgi:hypothetical protein
MLRAWSVLAITSFLAMVGACAVDASDPADPATAETWVLDPAPPAATPADPPAASLVDGGASQAVSCSIVQFCNAPGTDGTRCLQQGCSLTAALAECTTESRAVCGTPVCPWIFVAIGGARFLNGSCL